MRKSTYLTALICIAACLLVFFWQSNRISALESRSRYLQEKTAARAISKETQGAHLDRQTISDNGDGPDEAETPRKTADDLRALWPRGIDVRDPATIAIAIPKIVEAVAHCSTGQLLEISEELTGANSSRSDRLVTKLLLVMAAEEDPARALAFWDQHYQSIDKYEFVRSSLLAQLAKKDMPLAIEKIERDVIDPNDLGRSRIAVAQELLKSDMSAGLEILAKGVYCDPCMILGGLAHGFYNSGTAFLVAARDPQVAAELWSEVNQIKNGREREILTEGLLGVVAKERGSAGVSEAFSKIEYLEIEEHERLLFNTSINTRYTDPAGTIELFREHATTDRYRIEKVLDIFKSWIKKDLSTASTWLQDQAPSVDRDQMILKIIEKISASDAAKALTWAEKISDENLRAITTSKFE